MRIAQRPPVTLEASPAAGPAPDEVAALPLALEVSA
jgi:hypothetical protein